MAKSKLEKAVEERVESLTPAQKELVLSQFSTYKQNKQRISQLASQIESLDSTRAKTVDEVRHKQAERSSLSYEHNQLTTANSRIAAELFDFLKE